VLKTSFLTLFGPDCFFRNLVISFLTLVAVWVTDYWESAPDVTKQVLWIGALFYLLDTFTGAAVALMEGTFSSLNFRRGVWKFVAYSSSILVAVGLDYLFVGYLISDQYATVTVILTIIAVNEASSVIENSGKLGFPWPRRLIEMLEKIKECDSD
jgi:phage-related holin